MPLEATLREKNCCICNTVFKPNSARQKYCSKKCKHGTANCEICGKEFFKKSTTTGKFCSLDCWYKAPGKRIYDDRSCKHCDKIFGPQTATQKYCCTECANNGKRKERKHIYCLNCGKTLKIKASKRSIKFCSTSCALSGQSRRGIKRAKIGDTRPHSNGYVMIKVGKDYSSAFQSGWMMEHRYIMEQILERCLERNEYIHHKNGIRNDNRPENLELWATKKDPLGQRQFDLAKDAITKLTDEDRKELLTWLQSL